MIKILHLYSNLLNLYGEYGNVSCLKKHLEDQGLTVKVTKSELNEDIKFDNYDFIYCGSGLESNLKVALKDVTRLKASFVKALRANKYMLFTGNAMELLGHTIDGKQALGVLNFKTTSTDKRFVGDVIVDSREFGEIVGFINKNTIIESNSLVHIFTYIFKDVGLNENSNKEGYRLNNLLATHIIGPILVKNPRLLRYYVEALGKQENPNFVYKEISYPYEEGSYEVTLNALKNRKN